MKKILSIFLGIALLSVPIYLSLADERISSSGYKTGTLVEGMEKSFEFYGRANESYRIELGSNDDLVYFFGIYAEAVSDPIRYARVYPNSNREIIFTPAETKHYQFRLMGMYRYGNYSVNVDRISNVISTSPKRLSTGTTKSGTIAEGQTQLFEFYGQENSPLIFYVKSDGNVWFLFRLIDPKSNTVIEQRWVTRSEWIDIIFTPRESKRYHVEVAGTYDYGDYVLNLQKIPTH